MLSKVFSVTSSVSFLFLFAILLLAFLRDVECCLSAFLSPTISSILSFKIIVSKREVLPNLTNLLSRYLNIDEPTK